MKWKIIISCLFVCFILAKISAVPRRLHTLEELQDSGYASAFPRHGLLLIFWFAQSVHIDQNHIMHMRFNNWLFFRFGNYERILNAGNYMYMGNFRKSVSRRLPYYVRYNYENTHSIENNRDRLIISIEGRQITQVFVTTHDYNKSTFKERETFEITVRLILEIRRQNYYNRAIQNHHPVWFFLQDLNFRFGNRMNYCEPRNRTNRRRRHRHIKRMIETECDANAELNLQIESSENSYAIITWEEIPDDLLNMTDYIGLYKDADSENALVKVNSPITKSGELTTTIPLNPGLQIRLIHYNISQSVTHHTAIFNGSEFDEANNVMPTELKGYNVSLLLYVKDGHACARLYIEKSFTRWKTDFKSSWVGFFTNEKDNNDKHTKKVFVTKFTQKLDEEEDSAIDYYIYEYQSNLPIRPGMQARFMLNDDNASEKARTVPWDTAESENV